MPKRRTKSKAKHQPLTEAEWLVVRDLYEGGGMSNRQIAAHMENRITEAAVRARARRNPEDLWQKFEVQRHQIVQMALEPRPVAPTPEIPDRSRSSPSENSANPTSRTPPPSAEPVAASGPATASSQAYAQVRAETMHPRSLRNLQREAQQDLDDMSSALLNARNLLTLINSEVSNLTDRSEAIGYAQQDGGDRQSFGIDAKRINDLATANGRAIEQIRKIRGMDEVVPDEIAALKVLVDAGWLPPELLVEALKRFQSLKPSLRNDFRNHYTLNEEVQFENGSILEIETVIEASGDAGADWVEEE